MKTLTVNLRWVMLLLATAGLLAVNGCATTPDSENASVRPWNAPMGWENGLPTSMTEGH
ncbi:MAG TPA: hypothetical protein VNZ64_27300 [Candidatus Acidoferrum sp.]|nr:hypothetical protein [Candidatus Acidoferrum sp.]